MYSRFVFMLLCAPFCVFEKSPRKSIFSSILRRHLWWLRMQLMCPCRQITPSTGYDWLVYSLAFRDCWPLCYCTIILAAISRLLHLHTQPYIFYIQGQRWKFLTYSQVLAINLVLRQQWLPNVTGPYRHIAIELSGPVQAHTGRCPIQITSNRYPALDKTWAKHLNPYNIGQSCWVH